MALITKIEKQKKNIRRYSIFLDEEYSFSVSEDTLIKHRLAKGMIIDKKELEQILELEDMNLCKNYGLKLLGQRARSEYEIKDKMLKKGYNEKSVQEAIRYLKEYKYINDEEYAKCYIKDRVNIKKLGYNRVKRELYQKNIDNTVIEDTLNEVFNKEDEYERALELAERKRSTSYKNDDPQAAYRKLGGFLQRKGYSFDIIIKVLNKVLKQQ
ncbi:RecX family transcriptional regulator [Proteiniborus sp.]|uniref:RecX family transcriptional regulator n=1 Tax=Proteiniborus sp. TaxID=2079015 RepID=UPI00331755A8